MDYEQKYKHALDLAKQVHDTTISKQQKENIEIIFPELKESGDDEEIVKLADEYYDKVLLKECDMEEKDAHHCRISYIHGAKAMLERQKWKPSEEQLKFLQHYADQNNYAGTILTSLLNDLKKL